MTNGTDNRHGLGWTTTPLVRLAAFALILAVLAAAAALVGRASGLDVEESAGHGDAGGLEHGEEAPKSAGGNGLSDVADGLRLELEPVALEAGTSSRLALTIVDRHGEPIERLHGEHGEPPLHMILVTRDLAGYRHLHPRPNGRGYVVDLALPLSGIWRAYADFEVDGEKIVLARDLFVPGRFAPQPLPPAANSARAGSYEVEIRGQEVRAGIDATLRFPITRAEEPVVGLEPYLGAAGHLVAIRQDDLAYLHVHPLESSATSRIDFRADFAEPGRYALFLQFKHEGRVRTARFTVEVSR